MDFFIFFVLLLPCRMIDWLSWPLAQHVETWVIALLKGLAAVQKFTILIDVTLLKIELVRWKRAFKTEGEGKELLLAMQLCSIFLYCNVVFSYAANMM